MDSATTLLNDSIDFFYAYLAAIIKFKSTARSKTTLVDGKKNGIKKRNVLFVKRAVNKHIEVMWWHGKRNYDLSCTIAKLFVNGLLLKHLPTHTPITGVYRCRTFSPDREASTASMISFVVALVFTPLTSKGELDGFLYTRVKRAETARSKNSIIISFQLLE